MKSEFIVVALAAAAAARPAPQGVTEQIAPPAPIPSTCAVNFAGKFGIAVITDIRGRQVQPAATPEAAAAAMAGPPLPPPGMPLDRRMAQPQVTPPPAAAPGAGSDSTVTVRSTRTHTRTVTVRPIRATAAPAAPAMPPPELPMPNAGPAPDTYKGPHVNLLMVSQIGDGQIQAPITPVPVPIPARMPLPTVAPSGARTVTQISDGQPQAPMDTRPPTGRPAGAAPTPPSDPAAGLMAGPPAGPMPGGPMPGGPLPGGPPPAGAMPPGAMPGGPMGPPPEGMSLGLAGGPPAAGGPVGGPSPAAGGVAGGFPGLGPAGPGPMGDGMSLGLAGAGGAQLPPAGATVNRMELDNLESSYPAEGSDMSINRAMSGSDAGPGTLAACLTNGTLALTLNNGILKDNKGRTGYIASNRQFQFDDPPQHGSLYTAGFSVCSNGSLALGGSAVWWQCLSGNFYNLYDQWIAPQCHPIHISTIKLNQC